MKHIFFLLTISCMFFFSACGIKNNQTSTQSNIDVACTSKSETKVENLVIEDIKSTIHTFLDEYYKNINIVDNVFEGENIDYDIYYEERGYIIVKIAQEEEESNYLNGIFEVKMDSSLKNIVISDVEKCKSIWNSQDLILLSRDQLYIKKDLEVTYEDFDGKKERLLDLKENIIKHYFNKTDMLEHSNRPIFAETTEANSVYLLNFDQETRIYKLLIMTEDREVYVGYIEYDSVDDSFLFREEACQNFNMDDILAYQQGKQENEDLCEFMKYYDYMMEHYICRVDE